MSFEDEPPGLSRAKTVESLTRDQQILLHTIHYLTKWMIDDENFLKISGEKVWIKELPLWAIMYYQITNGSYESYDYAPTPIQFFGRSCFTINLSYEGVDDIEDLRELDILEKIRLSTSKHGFVTAYRITAIGEEYLKNIPKEVVDEVEKLFFCENCVKRMQFYMNMGDNPTVVIDCPDCDDSDVHLDFLESEDVSYRSKPYFLKISDLLIR
ncbi:MAG: hypothetical protein ACTSQ4_01775 [Candidatus Heimdallarchaeaceae archaeon]